MITVTGLALIICLFGGYIASKTKQKNESTNLGQSKSSLRPASSALSNVLRQKSQLF
jgi:hypothetical protein